MVHAAGVANSQCKEPGSAFSESKLAASHIQQMQTCNSLKGGKVIPGKGTQRQLLTAQLSCTAQGPAAQLAFSLPAERGPWVLAPSEPLGMLG